MKDYNSSIIYYKKSLELYPYDEKCLFNLGLVFQDLNELEKSKDYYKESLKIN